MSTPYRNAMIAKVQIARKQLSLDDITYRAMLEHVWRKSHCQHGKPPATERLHYCTCQATGKATIRGKYGKSRRLF